MNHNLNDCTILGHDRKNETEKRTFMIDVPKNYTDEELVNLIKQINDINKMNEMTKLLNNDTSAVYIPEKSEEEIKEIIKRVKERTLQDLVKEREQNIEREKENFPDGNQPVFIDYMDRIRTNNDNDTYTDSLYDEIKQMNNDKFKKYKYITYVMGNGKVVNVYHDDLKEIKLDVTSKKIECEKRLYDRKWKAVILYEVYDDNDIPIHYTDKQGNIYPLDYFEKEENNE